MKPGIPGSFLPLAVFPFQIIPKERPRLVSDQRYAWKPPDLFYIKTNAIKQEYPVYSARFFTASIYTRQPALADTGTTI